MRWGWLVASSLVAVSTSAADPRLEASGFVGLGWFGDDTELGNSWAPEQVPGTAPLVGARLAYVLAPNLVERDGLTRLAFAVEAELAMAAAYTGGTSFDGGGRKSYFAPVFGWRAHVALRAGNGAQVTPHLLAGIGGETVASASPFMSRETDPIFYYGPGVSIPLTGPWQLRIDMRHGIMAGRSDATSSVFELQFGVGATLDGRPRLRSRARVEAVVVAPTDPVPPVPKAPPPPPPPLDTDGDGLVDSVDKCPHDPEDRDDFADDDGCPDPDNDGDQILDAADHCPDEAETINGFTDDDGCPDEIPAVVTKAFTAASAIRFEVNSARVTPRAKNALDPLLMMLMDRRDLRIVIVGHPDRAGAEDLAKRRAEAVKWYLVDTGLIQDRIETAAGPVGQAPISIVLPDPTSGPKPPPSSAPPSMTPRPSTPPAKPLPPEKSSTP